MKKKHVTIYTDGACSGNPGPGGWGAVLLYGKHRKEISGFKALSTNNEMELSAALQALDTLKEKCRVDLYSDSAYLINAFTQGWVEDWKANGWKRKKDPLKNRELWIELDRQNSIHDIKWIKVKGHSDNVENNRCDELATGEIEKHTKKL
ncbi:MAG TPA: ribonuclease HI [Clostridia bacterium]|nr:ribonuclease HI [Clostridia bacterium]HPQ47749.1 ribonuclease HI [Clostridia bacterium]HRX41518.1 ribonuclease HI [Clostridia bacterium]